MPWTEEREAGRLGGVFSLGHNLVLCPRHHHGPHWAAVCPALLSGPLPAPPTGMTVHPQLGYYPQEVNEPPEPAMAQTMRGCWGRWDSLASVGLETKLESSFSSHNSFVDHSPTSSAGMVQPEGELGAGLLPAGQSGGQLWLVLRKLGRDEGMPLMAKSWVDQGSPFSPGPLQAP